MSTQLRLVEAPTERSKRSRAGARTGTVGRTVNGRVTGKGASTGARRAVHWGAWQLDDHTRSVGRAGVAAARRALEDARTAQDLRQAS